MPVTTILPEVSLQTEKFKIGHNVFFWLCWIVIIIAYLDCSYLGEYITYHTFPDVYQLQPQHTIIAVLKHISNSFATPQQNSIDHNSNKFHSRITKKFNEKTYNLKQL